MKIRYIVFWTLLVCFGTTVYQFFTHLNADEVSPPTRSDGSTLLIAGIAFLGFLAIFAYARRKALGTMAEVNRGVLMLHEGRYRDALAHLQRLQLPEGRNYLEYNRGCAHLSLWQLDEAIKALAAARTASSGAPSLAALAEPALAFAHALNGDTRSAMDALERLSELSAEAHPSALLARAVLAARDVRWTTVREITESSAMNQLAGPQRALADTLRSWADFKLGVPARPIDTAALFHESAPDVLGRAWPELVSFVRQPG